MRHTSKSIFVEQKTSVRNLTLKYTSKSNYSIFWCLGKKYKVHDTAYLYLNKKINKLNLTISYLQPNTPSAEKSDNLTSRQQRKKKHSNRNCAKTKMLANGFG